ALPCPPGRLRGPPGRDRWRRGVHLRLSGLDSVGDHRGARAPPGHGDVLPGSGAGRSDDGGAEGGPRFDDHGPPPGRHGGRLMDTPDTLAADMLKAAAEAIVGTRAIVQKGALNIKTEAKANVQQSAPVHNAHAANAITY